MSLTFYCVCWLYITVSPIPWSGSMSLIVSYGCWLSLTVSSKSMVMLHVSHCLI